MTLPDVSTLIAETLALGLLALPVAAITWVVTHEELFREPREWCLRKSHAARQAWQRKAFYVVTCEYCLSHWVALVIVLTTGFELVYPGWRGALIAWLALVWVANVYMTAFVRLKLDVKEERLEVAERETKSRRGE